MPLSDWQTRRTVGDLVGEGVVIMESSATIEEAESALHHADRHWLLVRFPDDLGRLVSELDLRLGCRQACGEHGGLERGQVQLADLRLRPLPCFPGLTPIQEALDIMLEHVCSGALVVDDAGAARAVALREVLEMASDPILV